MSASHRASSAIPDRATAHLHHEMRVRLGAVPLSIADPVFDDGTFVLSNNAFLFTTETGVRYHYAVSDGITASVPSAAAEPDFRLFLWGTVFGAVAWLNGYFPLHASAVDAGGRAVAFTGGSGAGKSTLAAALSAHGLPHVCDDTLALDLSQDGALAVPDRKPLKLWDDAFTLVPAERLEPIATMPGKSYAAVLRQNPSAQLFTDLFLLGEGEQLRLTEVRGAAKLDAVVGAMYRDFIPAALGRRRAYQRDLIAIANGIGIWRLDRPLSQDSSEFQRVTERIAQLVVSLPARS